MYWLNSGDARITKRQAAIQVSRLVYYHAGQNVPSVNNMVDSRIPPHYVDLSCNVGNRDVNIVDICQDRGHSICNLTQLGLL